MRKYLFALLVLVAAGTTLFVAALATADSGSNKISAKDGLEGYQEAPSLSTIAGGSFEADVANDGLSFDWTLSYRDLEGPVTQAHIHFAQRGVSRWHLDLALQDRGNCRECSGGDPRLSRVARDDQRDR